MAVVDSDDCDSDNDVQDPNYVVADSDFGKLFYLYIYKICFKKLQKLLIKYFPDDQLDLTIEEFVTENVEHQNIITLFTKVTKFSEKGWNFLKCCYLLYLCVL